MGNQIDSSRSNEIHPDGNAKTRKPQRDKAYYERHAEECISRANTWGREHPEKRSQYTSTERARKLHGEAHRRYLQTEKGRLYIKGCLERHKNTWKHKAAFLIYVLKEPCVVCGETDVSKLECDHLIPRALGGTDAWTNLQVMSKDCHVEKTKEDLRLIRLWKGV
jgi:5-methylcytosine-specific restriction endonuclease McrA